MQSVLSLIKESGAIRHKYRKILRGCQTMALAWVSVIFLQTG